MVSFAGNYPALVLNADFRPLSYYPLSVWCWQDTIKAVFMKRVNVVSEYSTTIHSPSMEMPIPSVIALKGYVTARRNPAFTRFNVFLRDGFTCQYCQHEFPTEALTFDHVIPRSRGGLTTWDNVVTACAPCNLTKGAHSPAKAGLKLVRPPKRPSSHELIANGRAFPPNYLHDSWRDFLYWDTELSPS